MSRKSKLRATASAFLVLNGSAALAVPSLVTLANFNGANGANPYAGVVADGSGNFYGTTYSGGAGGVGTVFKIAVGTNKVSTLVGFGGSNGSYPTAGLVVDKLGNLYGTSQSGLEQGTVFEIASGTNDATTLVNFSGANGRYPYAGLSIDALGNLYGTTYSGGSSNRGTVFEVAATTDAPSTLVNFTGANGSYPYSSVTTASSGDLYGTTGLGGLDNVGTVFKVAAGSNTLSTLVTFTEANGGIPYAGLTVDASGNLYGTTSEGGTGGKGTAFEIAAGTNTLTTLANFNGANGSAPMASLTADAAGNLFGTTELGGLSNDGTIFEIAAGTSIITTLANFNGSNGASPRSTLTADTFGNLYGTTYSGGTSGEGTVFELTGGGFAIPEPSSLTLAIIGTPLLLYRSRRKPDAEKVTSRSTSGVIQPSFRRLRVGHSGAS